MSKIIFSAWVVGIACQLVGGPWFLNSDSLFVYGLILVTPQVIVFIKVLIEWFFTRTMWVYGVSGLSRVNIETDQVQYRVSVFHPWQDDHEQG